MRKIIGLISAALVASLLSFGAEAQGPNSGGVGPQPAPSPWILNGPTISYNNGGITMPSTVTGGTKGVGTINVSGGFYVAGVNISGLPCTDCALKSGTLAQFASTTSAQLAGVISNETGAGVLVFNSAPTIISPVITTSFTATGLIGLTNLANQATNTVLANVTAGSAPPTALSVAGCTGSANALQWVTNTGFSCASIVASAGSITVGTTTISGGTDTRILRNNSGVLGEYTVTGTGTVVAMQASPAFTGPVTITSSSVDAFTVGLNGASNPTLKIDANTASSATGLSIKSAAAGGGLALSVISSGTNDGVTIDAKGSGGISLGAVSTGPITLTRATTLSSALTYGGVTLSNSVTGTGSMVLSTNAALTTPDLGTPSSLTLTNATGLPLTGLNAQAAYTLVGNTAGSSASPTAFSIPSLTQKASPVAGDILLLVDSAASNALKYATVSSIASAGSVASIAGNTGVFTLANGIGNNGNQIQLTAARRTLPTTQLLTASSGTYTTPANVLWIEIRMVGAGAGGSGAGSASQTTGGNGGNTCWNTSGAACTTPVYQAGGGVAPTVASTTAGANASPGGAGGSIAGSSTPNLEYSAGSPGGSSSPSQTGTNNGTAGPGGNSCWGAGGNGGTSSPTAGAAGANYGGGGGGGGVGGGFNGGSGGGSGACIKAIINSPAATYTYANGAAGTAGGAGTGGAAGGAGATGAILVIEHYGS